MGGKKPAGENTKKAAGNSKKAEAASAKAAVANAKISAAEDADWGRGAKSSAKKDDAEAKRAEAARKKAEKDALLAAEEKELASKGARALPKNSKTAVKKTAPTRSLDASLAQFDSNPSGAALNASGIDNALDALSLSGTADGNSKIDRHPERRFKAAYAAFEARRLPEIEEERPGLRKQQRVDLVRKEFEKSPENPFNQAGNVRYDSTRDEIRDAKEAEKRKIEDRLTGAR